MARAAGDFVAVRVCADTIELELAHQFPQQLYQQAAELGFLGLKYPESLGGQGGDYVHDAVWASVWGYVFIQVALFCQHVPAGIVGVSVDKFRNRYAKHADKKK